MATYSTGITATWGSVTFAEVQGLAWSYGGAGGKGWSSPWSDELGSVQISCLGTAGVGTGNQGTKNTLTITGGGMSLTCPAIYESVQAQAELNGVTRYQVTLKILDQ